MKKKQNKSSKKKTTPEEKEYREIKKIKADCERKGIPLPVPESPLDEMRYRRLQEKYDPTPKRTAMDVMKERNPLKAKEIEREHKELDKLEKDLKKLGVSDVSGYGFPEPPEPKLNYNTHLLYGAKEWCVLVDNLGKAYIVFVKNGLVHTEPL